METIQVINFIANILITIGISLFMVFVYGRSTMIDNLHFFERISIKLALAITACGSFFSALTFSNPPFSEVVFNIGLSIVFIWASWFHYKYFVKNKKQKK